LNWFSPQNIDFFYLKRLIELFLFLSFSFSSFFNTFFSLFSMLHLFGDFDDKRGEKHSSKISFQMKWNGMAKP
jgi:hypothetical protein